jgi:hypothetical protein
MPAYARAGKSEMLPVKARGGEPVLVCVVLTRSLDDAERRRTPRNDPERHELERDAVGLEDRTSLSGPQTGGGAVDVDVARVARYRALPQRDAVRPEPQQSASEWAINESTNAIPDAPAPTTR